MKEEFIGLFAYNHHSNQKVLKLVLEHPEEVSEKTINLVNHILNVHQIWNARILSEPEFGIWQNHSWEMLWELNTKNHEKSLQILTELDVKAIIKYTTSKGVPYTNTVKDILFHLINHSTYHRAQIATELKNSGIEPENTDYIFYARLTN